MTYFAGLTTMSLPPKLRSLLCIATYRIPATAPAPSSNNAANSPLLSLSSSSPGSSFGFGVPAVTLSPAATCFTALPTRNWATPELVVKEVTPLTTLTVNEVAWLPSTTTTPSLVVKLTEVPASVETRAVPFSSKPIMLLSVKLNFKLEVGNNSTRPNLLRFTVALLFSAVVIMLSENTVPPETAVSPFTVTWPAIDKSPDGAFAVGEAKTTIE